MSIITEAKNSLGEMKGWFEDVEAKFEPVAAKLARYENSAIVQTLEKVALSDRGEQMIATLISDLADYEAKFAAAPAAPVQPAEPAAPAGDAPVAAETPADAPEAAQPATA